MLGFVFRFPGGIEQFRGIKDSPNAQEAVKNVAHHAEDGDEFYQNMMTACWSEAFRVLKPGGLMAFTFHHSEPTQWAIVLEALMDSGFYIEAIYPVTSDDRRARTPNLVPRKLSTTCSMYVVNVLMTLQP